jgi:hypothetical protein
MNEPTTKKGRILKQLTLAIHMTQANYPADIVDAIVNRLDAYPEGPVLKALARCQVELGFPVKPKDIIDRIDDGRPGPEEAWALIPRDEATTVVWNDEIAKAWGIAKPVLDTGDKIGARKTFIESYTRILQEARAAGTIPQWTPSLGTDKAGQVAPIRAAIVAGRLPAKAAPVLIGEHRTAAPGAEPMQIEYPAPLKFEDSPQGIVPGRMNIKRIK